MRFELVRPIKEDIELIFNWRNDPETRANSYHSEEKVWEKFYPEFLSEKFRFPDLPPIFACQESERVAFLSFDPCEDFAFEGDGKRRRCCTVSINVAPKFRGHGIGSALLTEIQPWIKQQGYDAIYGEVKKVNHTSQKAFLRAGYKPLKGHLKWVDSREQVESLYFLADLVPLGEKVDPVYIVAEAGSNWRMGNYKRDLAMAKRLIEIAADAKADAVKFQVFRPETLYVENAGSSSYLKESGIEEPMSALFSDLVMSYEMVAELYATCQQMKIAFMATPFSKEDFAAVDPFVSHHKIASYELNHPHLLALAAHSKKPLFLSTGASTEEEIAWAVKTFYAEGGEELTLLQCTASYPATPASMNLRILPWLKHRFQVKVGLSDHSEDPYCAPVSAVALGATVIEKHFTLDKRLPGPDHAFAVTPVELKQLVTSVRMAEQMAGGYIKEVDPSEFELRQFARRGIQAISSIPQEGTFREGENIAILRPGRQTLGLHPKFLPEIEGKRATHAIAPGQGIQFGDYA
ncbi:MAG: GNAT family N-acetyltransferase [Parachlamydiaceae bacterium]|nr:GNAT family N-acetyltransferase [Parachlamydiaceae bacterium]